MSARTHLAWLMWCWPEGYTKPEDRAILTNWLLLDPAVLSPEDRSLRADLLQAADEVLAALASAPDEADHWMHCTCDGCTTRRERAPFPQELIDELAACAPDEVNEAQQ